MTTNFELKRLKLKLDIVEKAKNRVHELTDSNVSHDKGPRGTEKMRMIRDFKRSRVGMTGNRRRRRDHNLHCNSISCTVLIYKVSCQTTNINKVLQSLVNNGQHRNCGFPD